jgi:bacteriorhodopsin
VSTYKWGFYAFGTFAWLLLAYQTLVAGLSASRRFTLTRDYTILAGWTNLIWLLYPIAFGVSEGGNEIGVTESFIFFGILDLLLLPVLAFAFLFLSGRWDYGLMNLHFTQYGRVAQGAGTFPEKSTGHTAPATGTTATFDGTSTGVQGTAPANTAPAPPTQTV